MKYIKTYEQNSKEPEIDDYVICDETNYVLIETHWGNLYDFLAKNVGRYVCYNEDENNEYIIRYENVPKNIEEFFYENDTQFKNFRNMNRKEIKYWSKNKEDLETIIYANKYNL